MLTNKEHILLLWKLYLTNKASRAQTTELLQLIADEAHEAELLAIYEEAVVQLGPAAGRPSTAAERKEAWDQLMSSDASFTPVPDQARTPVHRVHFLRRSWFRYAAAVLLLVGAATWFWVGSKKDAQPDTKGTHDLAGIVPGHDQAILQLADGRTITLDSAQDGLLAKQGDIKVVKLQEGELSYSRESGAGSRESIQYNTLRTPRGGQYRLVLPDGSKVWLNAASSIHFPTTFDTKERRVTITGEAYFEIAKDKAHPFIVNVNDRSQVEVLGTHFNVNAYDNEGSIKTTLLEGKVKVSVTGSRLLSTDSRLLTPGEQSIITDRITVTNQISIDKVLAWKNGLFNFDGADVPTVMRQLERWYDIDVKYEGKAPDILFRGKLNRRVSFADVLEILPELGVKYRLEGKTLIVTN